MDLSFKPEYEEFRKEVRDFLDKELTTELREAGKLTASVFSEVCLLYTSPSPRDGLLSRMPSSA